MKFSHAHILFLKMHSILFARRIICDIRHGANIVLLSRHRISSSPRPPRKPTRWSLPGIFVRTIRTFWLVPLSIAGYTGYKTYLEQEMKKSTGLTLEKIDKIPPVDLPKNPEEIKALANHRVKLRGQFDHGNEFLLAQRTNLQMPENRMISMIDKIGYYVLTPFELEDGRRILVNRGWVSDFRKNPQTRTLGQVDGIIELNAYVSLEENMDLMSKFRATIFSKIPTWNSNNVHHFLDMEQLAKKLNIDPVAIFVADRDSYQKMGPIPGQISFDSNYHRFEEYRNSIIYLVAALLLYKII